jgi:hypothetical protein
VLPLLVPEFAHAAGVQPLEHADQPDRQVEHSALNVHFCWQVVLPQPHACVHV